MQDDSMSHSMLTLDMFTQNQAFLIVIVNTIVEMVPLNKDVDKDVLKNVPKEKNLLKISMNKNQLKKQGIVKITTKNLKKVI